MSVQQVSSFLQEVIEETPGGERIMHCLQCGSCGGSCPNSADMDHTPRKLIAMIAAEKRDEVLASNTMWCCVSCYFCTTRCPQNIPITDIMYALKRLAIAEGTASIANAPALAKTFTSMIDHFGRSYELGIAGLYHLLNRPVAMAKMGPMGMSMFAKGRMAIMPSKIKNIDQLQAIIKKARELGKDSR
jgi:heterodisulfide reductase subunit C